MAFCDDSHRKSELEEVEPSAELFTAENAFDVAATRKLEAETGLSPRTYFAEVLSSFTLYRRWQFSLSSVGQLNISNLYSFFSDWSLLRLRTEERLQAKYGDGPDILRIFLNVGAIIIYTISSFQRRIIFGLAICNVMRRRTVYVARALPGD